MKFFFIICLSPLFFAGLLNAQSSGDAFQYEIKIPGNAQPDGYFEPMRRYVLPPSNSPKIAKNVLYIKTKKKITAADSFAALYAVALKNVFGSDAELSFRAAFAGVQTQSTGLDRVYQIRYSSGVSPVALCRELTQNPEIEYAYPLVFGEYSDFIPSDSLFAEQWALDNINAPQAWDVCKGSPETTIAVIDAGPDWTHADLSANLKTNENEIPANGADDDENGKIDDYRGWDFVGDLTLEQIQRGEWDENPDPVNLNVPHGTLVTGCAAAVSDNEKGIASAGFQHKFIPIKCSSDNPEVNINLRSAEALVYAADRGADVVNCSWHSDYANPLEEDAVNYCASKGVLVVGSAGNFSENIDEFPQYPACFYNALGVGSIGQDNKAQYFSNFGAGVGVFAPGVDVLTTVGKTDYVRQKGTSFSTPIVSAIAASLKALHPHWSAKQIAMQIIATSSQIPLNPQDKRRDFAGRLNAYEAFSYNNHNFPGKEKPGVEVVKTLLAHSDRIRHYAPIKIKFILKNHLADADNLLVKIEASDDFVVLEQYDFALGNLPAGASDTIETTIRLTPENPWFGAETRLTLELKADGFAHWQIVRLPIEIDTDNKFRIASIFYNPSHKIWRCASSPSKNICWLGGFDKFTGNGIAYRFGAGDYFGEIANSPISTIFAFDDKRVFAGNAPSDGNARIFQTDDGEEWTSVGVASLCQRINNIHFFDSREGVFLGDPYRGKWGAARSTDGGEKWYPYDIEAEYLDGERAEPSSYCWLGDYGWFGTNQGRVFKSSDRGESWTPAEIDVENEVKHIAFASNENGIAISINENGEYLCAASDNGGETWETNIYNFSANKLQPLKLFARGNFYALCVGGEVFTSESGATWTPVLSYQFSEFAGGEAMSYLDRIRFWAYGDYLAYLDFPMEDSPAKIDFSPVAMVFDSLELGASSIDTLVLRNVGERALRLYSIEIIDSAGYPSSDFVAGELSAGEVPAGDSLEIHIKFEPLTKGEKIAYIRIISSAKPNLSIVQARGVAKDPSGVAFDRRTIRRFDVSPNPANDILYLNIELAKPDFVTVYLYDGDGKLVKSAEAVYAQASARAKLPVSEVSGGAYFVQAVCGEVSIFRKIIIKK